MQPPFQDHLGCDMIQVLLVSLAGPGLDSSEPFIGAQHRETVTTLQSCGEFIGVSTDWLAAAVNIQGVPHQQGLGMPLSDKRTDPVPIRAVVMDGNDLQRRSRISQCLTYRHTNSFCTEIETEQGGGSQCRCQACPKPVEIW